jgi:hypothetical protein
MSPSRRADPVLDHKLTEVELNSIPASSAPPKSVARAKIRSAAISGKRIIKLSPPQRHAVEARLDVERFPAGGDCRMKSPALEHRALTLLSRFPVKKQGVAHVK